MDTDIEYIKKKALSFIKAQFDEENIHYLDIRDVDLLTTLALKIEKANLDNNVSKSLEDAISKLHLKYDAPMNHNPSILPPINETNFLDIEVTPQ